VTEFQPSRDIDAKVTLSDEERQRVAARSRAGLLSIYLWQVGISIAVSALFFVFLGVVAGLSALAGAGCYLAPNALFVTRLLLSSFKPGGTGSGVFLIGNLLKLLAAAGLLWFLAESAGDQVNWVAALVGLIAALKGYWVGLLFSGGRLGKRL
jgi:ATP synthase protein I